MDNSYGYQKEGQQAQTEAELAQARGEIIYQGRRRYVPPVTNCICTETSRVADCREHGWSRHRVDAVTDARAAHALKVVIAAAEEAAEQCHHVGNSREGNLVIQSVGLVKAIYL